MPTSVLVDGAGRILGRLEGHAEWDTLEALALIRHFMAREAAGPPKMRWITPVGRGP